MNDQSTTSGNTTIGLIGARGYVGYELLKLIAKHPHFELAWASSRQKNGQPIGDDIPGLTGHYCEIQPNELAENLVDIYVLALPNGLAQQWVEAIDLINPEAVIIDLSADYRFDPDWQYGLTEFHRTGLKHSRRISNPGCYASAMQLAIKPLLQFPIQSVTCFGVSGCSGAGSKPSPNNDPKRLHDNLKAYQLTDHIHEREVSHQLAFPISFTPTVAAFFRGIQMTTVLHFNQAVDSKELHQALDNFYHAESLITIGSDIPEIRDIRETPDCHIGGLQVSADGQRAVLISVLDNLLKGAASQAMQNLNLACGFPETTSLHSDNNL